MATISLKVDLAGDIRRISVARDAHISAVGAQLALAYGVPGLVLKYADPDGDLCRISNQSEWLEACACSGPLLRLTAVPAATPETVKASAADAVSAAASASAPQGSDLGSAALESSVIWRAPSPAPVDSTSPLGQQMRELSQTLAHHAEALLTTTTAGHESSALAALSPPATPKKMTTAAPEPTAAAPAPSSSTPTPGGPTPGGPTPGGPDDGPAAPASSTALAEVTDELATDIVPLAARMQAMSKDIGGVVARLSESMSASCAQWSSESAEAMKRLEKIEAMHTASTADTVAASNAVAANASADIAAQCAALATLTASRSLAISDAVLHYADDVVKLADLLSQTTTVAAMASAPEAAAARAAQLHSLSSDLSAQCSAMSASLAERLMSL